MFDYVRNIEEKHCSEEEEFFGSFKTNPQKKNEDKGPFTIWVNFKLLSLKLLIVPFYQEIVTKAILSNLAIDVCGIFAIIWLPFHMNFIAVDGDEPILMGIANFLAGLFLSPFIMALAAIDLCFNLIVLLLSPITRSLATIGHMLSYAFSGANASTHDSNDGLTNR